MKFRFMGNYTNGHDSIDAGGILFHDRDPSDVPEDNEDLIRRLSNNPEFAKAKAATDPVEEPRLVAPKPRKAHKAKK